MLTCRRSVQARKNAMAPTARSAPLEKIGRLAETRERQIPCSVWASAWAPKTKKMRLLEIRRAHPLNHREPLVHTFAYQNVLFQITPDRSCCRAETPRAHPEEAEVRWLGCLGSLSCSLLRDSVIRNLCALRRHVNVSLHASGARQTEQSRRRPCTVRRLIVYVIGAVAVLRAHQPRG